MKVRGLTLWRPWTTGILYGPKRVENRPRRWHIPKEEMLLAIHGGMTFDKRGAEAIRGLWLALDDHLHPTGIVGACRVTEVRQFNEQRSVQDPWAFGPYCYYLEDVVALRQLEDRAVGVVVVRFLQAHQHDEGVVGLRDRELAQVVGAVLAGPTPDDPEAVAGEHVRVALDPLGELGVVDRLADPVLDREVDVAAAEPRLATLATSTPSRR